MKHLNLLVDCHCFDLPISQGITTYIQGLYQILPSLASDIDFYFVALDVDKIKSIFGNGNNVHYIPLTSKKKIFRLLFEMPNIINKNNIDVAHFQYISPLIRNCKTIVTLHDILFVDFPDYFPLTYRLSKGPLFKMSAKKADLLCSVSEYSKKRIVYHYGIDENKIVVTPNAVSPDFFSENNSCKSNNMPKKYILYVSRIEPRKNHIALVKAFERLKLAQNGYFLVFIGRETVPTPELRNLIDSLPTPTKEHVMLISQVNYSDLKEWYRHASLFVYPSIAEGFGIPPIEAAASGVPVICNNATAMSDFSFFGDNLIDINNEFLLDKKISKILSERDNKDLSNISHIVKNKYDWHKIASDFNHELNIFR